MSEYLGPDFEKQEKLKNIVKRLHDGESTDSVKKDFSKLIRKVSPEEIVAMEQALIQEGLAVSEVQRLCDVHVDVFKSGMSGESGKGGKTPGHPVHTFKLENKESKAQLKALKKAAKRFQRNPDEFRKLLDKFSQIEKHYTRKENQLFPHLERVGFTGPSKVMWGKHDEIRAQLKAIRTTAGAQGAAAAGAGAGDAAAVKSETTQLARMVRNMIFMEERILYPNALKRLSDGDWAAIRSGENEIGYAWVQPGHGWDAHIAEVAAAGSAQHGVSATGSRTTAAGIQPLNLGGGGGAAPGADAGVPLDTGGLTPQQLNMMLKVLPVDVTFVDENDEVRYYSAGAHRVFPRSPAIIGRKVQNCHPPNSVHIVEDIIESFLNKEKDVAEFWIEMKGRFIHIRYYPVYDEHGEYRGTVEVSQDVTEIRALEGERRLLEW